MIAAPPRDPIKRSLRFAKQKSRRVSIGLTRRDLSTGDLCESINVTLLKGHLWPRPTMPKMKSDGLRQPRRWRRIIQGVLAGLTSILSYAISNCY